MKDIGAMSQDLEIQENDYGRCEYNSDGSLSLIRPEVLRNPYPTYERLRLEHPAYWSDEINHWVISRYDDVSMLLHDHKKFSNRRAQTVVLDEYREFMDPFIEKLSLWMSFMDPPDHKRIRSLLNIAFTHQQVQSLQSRIQNVIDFLIEPVMAQRQMDLVRDFAYPLPAIVISEILGSGVHDRDLIKKWSYDIAVVAGVTSSREALEAGQKSMLEETQYFRDLVVQRRKNPTSDLISLMIQAQEKEDRLNDEEIVAQCIMTILAGHETTESLIASGVYSLFRFPDQFQMLLENPALLEHAIPELLRYESPLQGLTRIATADVELHGKTMRKGDSVLILLGAANRDPDKFSEPDRLEIRRKKNHHLAFGKGIHVCLGTALAQMESRIAFETILTRMSQIVPINDTAEWSATNIIFRGLSSLPVRF